MVEVMMREPPAAPVAKKRVWFFACSAITGEMLDSGRLLGRM